MSDGKILSTGFSRMSERQVALWDPVSASDLNHLYSAAKLVILFFYVKIFFRSISPKL